MSFSKNEAEEMANSLGAELELTEDQVQILRLSYLSAKGLAPKQAVAELPHLNLADFQESINVLLAKGLVRAFKNDNTMSFKGVSKAEFAK